MNNEAFQKVKNKTSDVAKKGWGRLSNREFWNQYGYLALCAIIPGILEAKFPGYYRKLTTKERG